MVMMEIPVRPAPGERLRRALEIRGWSQYTLTDRLRARGSSIARQTVNRIVAGRVDPDLDTVWQIGHVLGFDPAWLAGYRDGEPELPELRESA